LLIINIKIDIFYGKILIYYLIKMQTISTTAIENNSQRLSQESAENLNLAIWFEHDMNVDFKKLNELIEHSDVQRLDISSHHPIFVEIKKIFEVILTMDRSVINGWKYKNTFLNVERSHYDNFEVKKVQFIAMNWIDSFVTSFIMHLYH
jgi:hypothetical protein